MKSGIIPEDKKILRELAKQYLEICFSPQNEEKRMLWRRHNSLKKTRPLFIALTRTHFIEDKEAYRTRCNDPFLVLFERELKRRIYHAACNDDTVFEPWLVHNATYEMPREGTGPWGVPFVREDVVGGTGWHIKPTIIQLEDIQKILMPHHRINEKETNEGRDKLLDTVGDILTVVVDRGPMLRSFPGDISTDIGFLRGQEQMLWDMVDNPDWYHKLLLILRDGVLTNHDECETAGDWSLVSGDNQSMPYSEELPSPEPSGKSFKT